MRGIENRDCRMPQCKGILSFIFYWNNLNLQNNYTYLASTNTKTRKSLSGKSLIKQRIELMTKKNIEYGRGC